jgi:trigger factor
MDVQVESLSQVRRRMKYAVPATTVGAAFSSVIAKINARAKLPGFRPGKAPAAMIERMYGSDVRRQVLDKVLQDTVFSAIDKAGIRVVGRPEVEELSDLRRDAELQVTVQVEVLPELSLSGYEGVALVADAVQADAADLDQALEEKARSRAEWVTASDAAGAGDEVELDYLARQVDSEDAPMSGEKRRVLLGSGRLHSLIEGVALGLKGGESVERTVTAGEADAPFAAGSEVSVQVTVHEVQRQEIPAIDDELAKDLGERDLAALKASVQAKLQDEARQATRDLQRRAAVDQLIAANTIEVPTSVVESYVDEQVRRAFGQLDRRMMEMLRGYLDSMRRRMATDAEKSLRRSLALEAIAKDHSITVDDATVDAEIERLVQQAEGRKETVRRQYAQEQAREELRRRLQHEQAMDLLVQKASMSVGVTRSLAESKAAVQAADDAAQAAAEAEEDSAAAQGEAGHVHDEHCGHDH